jgi:hypothetical protein
MKRLAVSLAMALALCAALAAPAMAEFGLKDLGVTFTDKFGEPTTQAGSHPFEMTTTLGVNTIELPPSSEAPGGSEIPDGELRNLTIEQIPGLAGTPTPTPPCPTATFIEKDEVEGKSFCPDSTAVGYASLRIAFQPLPPTETKTLHVPVFNLVPPPGVAAKLGFLGLGIPVTIDVGLSSSPPYNIVASLNNIPQAVRFYGSTVTLWGNPSDSAHDPLRGKCLGDVVIPTSGPVSEGICSVDIPAKPFLTLPRACTGPLLTTFEANTWRDPDERDRESVATHEGAIAQGMTGCGNLGFGPTSFGAQPTTDQAESPSGLDVSFEVNDEGLTSPDGEAQSDIKKAVVTLPQGVTVNPSVAEGLATCTPADLDRESVNSEPGEGCPQASKVGSVEVESPLLEGKSLRGSLFVAQQDDPATAQPGAENPFDSMIALYMVIKDPELGIMIKLPGKVEPDERTGQLVSSFDDLPQLPVSNFRFHLREGGRSPLVTPPTCGEYTTRAQFTPWADPSHPLTTSSSFKVTTGVNGGPCPAAGVPPFRPGFVAGSINNNAGSYSPFYVRLTRSDGEQDMTRFSSILPPGVLGKLAGVAKCSDAAVAIAKGKTGRQEIASPSCPADSQIGRVLAGAGVGSALTYVPGKIYLGGPFAGDPLSAIVSTPAVAGPFDAGTVVVREALTLDPETAEVQVDGAHSDPIPHILKGIPLKLRDLRVYVDRANFTVNPTSCNPLAARATLFGSFLDVFSPADDVPVALSSRYQAAGCRALGFKPKLALKLTGGTKRGSHPALRAVVTPRPRDANFAKAVVTLPHSAFLEQAHIRTVCTRVQFSAKKCPKGSIYGRARAITPLLDEPLEGPVYLRSSNHPLPDLVAALHGVVDINLVGRIDSVDARIRSSFERIPDAAVTKFVLEMQGGKKGLIVNSRNLCAHTSRAIARFTGQNGKVSKFNPKVKNSCKKTKRSRSQGKRR